MLTALLANNNNAQPLRTTFRVDPRASSGRSHSDIDNGGGRSRQQLFNVADIIAAAAIFPEIAREDPAARTARRARWISEVLPFVKEAREKREAAVFLAGAQLADAAAEERHAAQIVEIIEAIRRESAAPVVPALPAVPSPRPRVPYQRGDRSLNGSSIGLFLGGLIVGGLLVGHVLRKQAPRRSRR